MRKLRFGALICSLLLMLSGLAMADDGLVATDKGWNRAALFAALLDLTGPSASLAEVTANLATGGAAAQANAGEINAKQSSGLDPGDHIWFLTSKSIGSRIVLAGSDEFVSTISIYAPIVGMTGAQQHALAKFNADLFGRMFPDWSEGNTWLFDSLGRTWTIISKNEESHDPEVMAGFVEQIKQGPVFLSSTGVPPDIHIWRLTIRPNCRISIGTGNADNPFQRWVC
jgi:hypothetical protein